MPNIRVLNEMQIKQNGVTTTYKIGSIDGYYKSSNGKFYEESTYINEIEGMSNVLYIDLGGNALYIYKTASSSFVKVSGEGGGSSNNIIKGYYNITNGKFYEDSSYTIEITPDSANIYIDLNTNYIYRYNSTETEYVQIGGEEIDIDTTPTEGSTNAVQSGGVYTALEDKVDKETGKGLSTNDYTNADAAAVAALGTASTKNSTNSVTAGSTDLVESDAVKTAIDNAVTSAYKAGGSKTCAELTSALLVAANEGMVYNISDTGTTTADFIEGAGKEIGVGSDVAVIKVGNAYKFNLLPGIIDLSNYIQKSNTSGLVKNDGSIDTKSYVEQVSGKGLSTNDYTTTEKNKLTSLNNNYYGTSTGQAALQNKAVVVSANQNFELKVGCVVVVKFDANNTYTATADAPITINVNNTGAKQIYFNNTATPTGAAGTVFGVANHFITYMYDGTYWVWIGHGSDSNTTYSAMSVAELTTGTATNSRAVRADYLKTGINSLIDTKIPNTNGTVTNATNAETAFQAIQANSANSADYANNSNYANTAGTATTANNIPVNPSSTTNLNIWITT